MTPDLGFQTGRGYTEDNAVRRSELLLEANARYNNFLPVIEDLPTGLSICVFGSDYMIQSLNTRADKLYDGAAEITERRSLDADIVHFDRTYYNILKRKSILSGSAELESLPIRSGDVRRAIKELFEREVRARSKAPAPGSAVESTT